MLRIAITDGTLQRRSVQIGTAAAIAELLHRVRPLTQPRGQMPAIDFLLLREKDLAPDTLVDVARQLVSKLTSASTRLLLAGAPTLALAAGAHGVHLAADGDIAEARRQMPHGFLTISCHTLEEVSAARAGKVSAILFGPVFGKVVAGIEVVPGTGLDPLRLACQLAAPVPVVALGGVTDDHIATVLDAGAAGIAAIRLFFRPLPH